jgi:uncharacterized membrane protein
MFKKLEGIITTNKPLHLFLRIIWVIIACLLFVFLMKRSNDWPNKAWIIYSSGVMGICYWIYKIYFKKDKIRR